MKYKITEIDSDAADLVAVKVVYTNSEDEAVSKSVFHFEPTVTRQEILDTVAAQAPEEAVNEKAASAKSLVLSLASDVNKEFQID